VANTDRARQHWGKPTVMGCRQGKAMPENRNFGMIFVMKHAYGCQNLTGFDAIRIAADDGFPAVC
jgi:hypothetical protein